MTTPPWQPAGRLPGMGTAMNYFRDPKTDYNVFPRFAFLEKHKENEEKVLTQQRRLIGGKLVLQGASQKIEPEYRYSQNKVLSVYR